jgi:hypothetical protein
VFNKGANAFQNRTNALTLEYRSQEEGVFVYLNDGLLDMNLAGGSDRNDQRRSLQVGDSFEDVVVSPSYFVGTGAANEWAAIGAPPPTPFHRLRPNWFEFDVLTSGQDAIGKYVDIAVNTVTYVPPGDLNSDGFFNQLDVNAFASHWRADTDGLNSVAQWMMGDLDNSGRVELNDAYLLRKILIEQSGQSYTLMRSIPEPSGAVLSCMIIMLVLGVSRRGVSAI